MKTLTISALHPFCPMVCSLFLLSGCGSSDKPSSSGAKTPAPQPAAAAEVSYGVLSVTPDSGSGREQIFRVKLAGTAGTPSPVYISLLMNDRLDGANACYAMRVLAGNHTLLVHDSGSGTEEAAGSAGSISNRQCEVVGDRSTTETKGSEINVQFHLKFKPIFKGKKNIFLRASGENDHQAKFATAGSWIVD